MPPSAAQEESLGRGVSGKIHPQEDNGYHNSEQQHTAK